MEHEACKTVLVVDDDRVFASRLASALRACGYQTIESNSVAQAHSMLDSHKVDLAVIDLNLPDKSGLELIHTTRTACKEIRILATSGVLGDLHLQVAKYMGADAAVHKFDHSVAEPFPASEWLGAVENALRER
jgi:CheY-like chemotaxis protein